MAGDTARSRRLLETTGTLGLGVVLMLALFAIVNYFGWKYHWRGDWTSSRIYTLSEKSRNVLRELDRDVEAVVFIAPGEELYEPVVELLARYEAASPRFRVRRVDPQKNLAEAQSLVERFELPSLSVVVFDAGDDRRVVDAADLADFDFSALRSGGGAEMTAFKGEQVFTSALVELVEQRKPRILFTTGHGERSLDDLSAGGLSMARNLLGTDNFEIEEWASLGEAAVPQGVDLVVVAGPTSSFLEPEIELLRGYLEGGGRLLVLLDPTLSGRGELVTTGLEELLAGYGVRVGRDIVVDPANPLPFFGAETIYVDAYGDHPITRALDQSRLPVLIPLARSVGRGAPLGGLEIETLLRTSDQGWGETDLAALDRVEKGDDDLAGPVSLGVVVSAAAAAPESEEVGSEVAEDGEPGAAEGTPEAVAEAPSATGDLRLLVIGDSDMVTNTHLQSVPNATFFANAINWLVERETLVGIPPKRPEQVRLSLTGSQFRRVSWLVLGVLPVLALAAGAVVHFRRRR